MADKRIKPDILSNNTLLRRNIIAEEFPNFQELLIDDERDVKVKIDI